MDGTENSICDFFSEMNKRNLKPQVLKFFSWLFDQPSRLSAQPPTTQLWPSILIILSMPESENLNWKPHILSFPKLSSPISAFLFYRLSHFVSPFYLLTVQGTCPSVHEVPPTGRWFHHTVLLGRLESKAFRLISPSPRIDCLLAFKLHYNVIFFSMFLQLYDIYSSEPITGYFHSSGVLAALELPAKLISRLSQ